MLDDRVRTIEEQLGPVDILVNNTGGPPPTPAAGQDPALWWRSFQSMVLSVIAITDRVLPGMREREMGPHHHRTSSGVVAPIPNLGISNALRLSLVGWSKTLAREVGRDGITANIVLPGRIATAASPSSTSRRPSAKAAPSRRWRPRAPPSIPVGRYGRPEEYGDVVAFLASERAAYITGCVIRVDGGLIASI